MKKDRKEMLLPIYSTGREYYVRFTPLETNRFRHGLAFASTNEDEELVKAYRDDIWDYLVEAGIIKDEC